MRIISPVAIRVTARWVAARLATLFCVLLIVGMANAQQSPFYAGKTIKIISSADAASTYTTYPQLVAQHLARFIPGNPSIIVQTMPGAGGVVAANYMAALAPRDGTVMASVHDTLTMTQVLTPAEVRYDMGRFNWIGVMSRITSVLSVSDKAPATTLEAAKTKEVILGSTGPGSVTHILPALLNTRFGTRYKVVEGYGGMGQMNIAIERGEIHGRAGSLTSWSQVTGGLVGHIVHVVQVNSKKDPSIPQTPLLSDLARHARERAMLEFMSSPSLVGRSLFAPQDVPVEQVTILRDAFNKMMSDPAFLADAAKRQHDIDPVPGIEVERAIRETLKLPRQDAETLRSAIGL